MEYFKILNFTREPFSNSPDPEAFFQSRQHVGCLQKLELSLRMKRGLNVVIGDVGTGKTTLCRQLIRLTADDTKIESHLILDPTFSSDSEFLRAVAALFGDMDPSADASDWQLKESIKQYLFRRGVDEQKIVLLIIDEGQKIPDFCLEILREFLNYETNEHKLLQIAIFAQKEFSAKIEAHKNFADRINLYHTLNPLNFEETRAMVHFRLNLASADGMGAAMFSMPAFWMVYQATRGYPRKIINLCHRIILTMIIQNRNKAGFFVVLSCAKRVFPEQVRGWQRTRAWALAAVLLLLVSLGVGPGRIMSLFSLQKPESLPQLSLEGTTAKPTPPVALAAKNMTPGQEKPQSLAGAFDQANDLPAPEKPVAEKEAGMVPGQLTEAADEPEKQIQLPDILGKVTVSEQETLSRMIHLIYGSQALNRATLLSVLAVNPHIREANVIIAGDVISFPVLPVKEELLPANVWWVHLTSSDILAPAYKVMAMVDKGRTRSNVRLIPQWQGKEGIKFIVVLRDFIDNENSARQVMADMPAAIAGGAMVVSSQELSRRQSLFQLAGNRSASR